VRRAQPWLGTLVEVTVCHRDEHAAMRACDAALRAVARIDRLMSFHKPHSELSRLNRAPAAKPMRVSAHTWRVLACAERLHRVSGGLFDCTVVPHLRSGGFLPRSPCTTDPDAVARMHALRATQADVLLPAPGWVVKRCPLELDLGGIAKGYAVDRALVALRAAGARAGCVNAGGDLRVFGTEPHRIEVRHPGRPGDIGAVITVQGAAVATSAGYYARQRGARGLCTPIVDPFAGTCIDYEHSVTVAAGECVIADALTKVVALSGDPAHPALAHFRAQAWILGHA
jgi:thiamine biosynthesis lipoprotein